MSGPCGVNPSTGFCDICQCYSAEIDGDFSDTKGQWYCVGGEHDRQSSQRHRDEDDLLPEEELEFRR